MDKSFGIDDSLDKIQPADAKGFLNNENTDND